MAVPVCIVEVPKGARNKYEYDPDVQAFRLDRFVSVSVVFPGDYGFLEGTCAEDGEPLDALLLVSEPTFPGCRIDVCPVALLCAEDEQGRDDTVIGVPLTDPGWREVRELADVSRALRLEIEHFFAVYKDLDAFRRSRVLGWRDRAAALEAIERARVTRRRPAPG